MNFYVWAVFSTVISIFGLFYWSRSTSHEKKRKYIYYSLSMLPFSALVNFFVKKPIGHQLTSIVGVEQEPTTWPLWYVFVAVLIAPITEEFIKLTPLLRQSIRTGIYNSKASAYWTGFYLGFGFGVGETWYLAYALSSKQPDLATGAFLPIVGFFGERTAVCFAHACMTSIVTAGFHDRSYLKYFLLAIVFHYSLNIGAGLFQCSYISVELATVLVCTAFIFLFRFSLRLESKLPRTGNSIPKERVIIKKS